MRRFYRLHTLLLFFFSTTVFSDPSYLNYNPETLSHELESVTQERSHIETELVADQSLLQSSQEKLRILRKEILEQTTQKNALSTDIDTINKELRQFQTKKEALKRDLAIHQQLLARNIAAFYAPQTNSPIKLLLYPTDHVALRRSLALYQYLQEAQQKAITDSTQALTLITQIEESMLQKQMELEEKQQALALLLDQMSQKEKESQTLVVALEKTIQQHNLSKQILIKKEQDLSNLLTEITHSLVTQTENAVLSPSVLSQKGLLDWPMGTMPSVKKHAKNQALVFTVPTNTPIKAIYSGKIIFSDWLNGYGLLIIVDHGDNFMSIYGYNNQLLKHPGEQVLQGDTIAIAGDPDQQQENNFYFQLRYQDKPVNPDLWLHQRG